ncbi:MAG: hypothetical protein JJU00_00615 [Opitutales bacterium]|nr:hypothetical protein [Opitutales bacterium]
MKKRIHMLTLAGVLCAAFAQANTPLLVDPNDFSVDGDWIAGANQFQPVTEWVGFATLDVPDRVSIDGDAVTFMSWDDETSDKIESFLFQEFGAGPVGSPTANELFEAGDVIVFRGEASATRTGADTSNMIVRAFVKMLGFNELGWEFQTKPDHTQFHNIGPVNEPFELSVTFPDLSVDDSFQVLQVGFEITTEFDGSDMDSGTITFRNIEAFIEGEANGEPDVFYAGMLVDANGNVDTGDFLGVLHVAHAPWVYVFDLARWVYMPDPGEEFSGAWAFLMR